MNCAWCGSEVRQRADAINQAVRIGAPLYCNRVCYGLARRKNLSIAELKERKRLYDIEYRSKNLAKIKSAKKEYFRKTYDPDKAKQYRASRMHLHVEYCRTPEYKEWKNGYDKRYRASEYGEFAEAHMLLVDLEREINQRQEKYERYAVNGLLNKKQTRRRDYDQAFGL